MSEMASSLWRASWPGLCALAVYVLTQQGQADTPFPRPPVLTEVNLPLPAQVAVSGGDAYLAANIGTFRALIATTEADKGALAVQAAIQRDASRLNPGHEDNYYLASGVLIGGDEHRRGMAILHAAIAARPFDFVPPFFYGVNRLFYDNDALDAANWARLAASRADSEENRMALEKTAARWIQKGAEPAVAAKLLNAMAAQSRSKSLRDYYEQRARQAQALVDLSEAVARYRQRFGEPPSSLQALVSRKVVDRLPEDPLGRGFVLGADGRPALAAPKRRK